MTVAVFSSATGAERRRRRRGTIAVVLAMSVVITGCGNSGKAATSNPRAAHQTPGTTAPSVNSGQEPTPSPPTGPAGTEPTTPPGRTFLRPDQYGSTSELPKATGPAKSTHDVLVFQLDAATEAGMVEAFDTYEALPATCTSETIPGTVYLATVKATGVSFAVAGFQPAPGCYSRNVAGQISPGGAISAFEVVPPPPVGLFERQRGGQWVMNTETGKPFPCPPYPSGHGPGPRYPIVPKEVLAAWNIPYYSSTCITIPPHPPA